MSENKNIFINKKILIYGLGKTGISTFKFLKRKNYILLFDDNKKIKFNKSINANIKNLSQIKKTKLDLIIISPGIDKNKCKLKNFLKKFSNKIYTDLDVFFSFYKNKCITITGTNGKSTTCQLIYNVFKKKGIDVKLAGNIGYPILSIKNIKPKSVFVIEASSYQLDYSQLFSSKYAALLNISPDHIERHKNFKNYISAKFKLLENQTNNSTAFINRFDKNICSRIIKSKHKSKIIKVNTKLSKKYLRNFQNDYFSSLSNQENLSFAIEISKKFNIRNNLLFNVVNRFRGLKYRQQIIFKNKNFSIINDSKSTSYSSSIEMLKRKNITYWILGGIPKKGDKFNLSKDYYKNIKGYIFGEQNKKFVSDLKNKIEFKKFSNLRKALDAVMEEVKIDNYHKKTILFSPSGASFDSFKNFEERGSYFNKLIKKNFNGR